MLDYVEFISKQKSMLNAPAGYGKTHTITECLKHVDTHSKQLILTHTHAGVSSIKEKLKKEGIHSSKYDVETIASFAQKYALSFHTGSDIPEQDDGVNYYPFILDKATKIIQTKAIKKVIRASYQGLFVDEYQDCTVTQHAFILALSNLLPTRILGDFLQGIFGFNGEALVDLESMTEMGEFAESKYELSEPWRWQGQNESLGQDLKRIRENLLNEEVVNLNNFQAIEKHLVEEGDLYNPSKDYNKKIRALLTEDNLLILHPDSSSINKRLAVIKLFGNRLSLIESIDDKSFYSLSREADAITSENLESKLILLSEKLFNKTGVSNWFNPSGFKRKTKVGDKALVAAIMVKVELLKQDFSFSLFSEVLTDVKRLPGMSCYRRELFSSFVGALAEAEYGKVTVLQAMKNKRNLNRRVGRKVFGKNVGTTLLTKGLEFDTVVILNAHDFKCPKHLYVALTRACRRLIVFTNSSTLQPYS